MIWDVISAEQESKQQRYLQKVSHMLNRLQGLGGRTRYLTAHTCSHVHTLPDPPIIVIVEQNQTCPRKEEKKTQQQPQKLHVEL